MPVILATCTCKSNFQDKEYGTGVRVFNTAPKIGGIRCSVCNSEKRDSITSKKK